MGASLIMKACEGERVCHQYCKISTAAKDRELAPQRGRRIMKGEREAVEQDQFVIDSPTLTTLVEGIERATWEGKVEGAPIMTLSGKSAELRRAITSLANALVQAGKIKPEEGSGNVIRAHGPCTLSISAFTHVVLIASSGSLPTIGDFSISIGTITHAERGKIHIKAGSVVYFSFYSEHPSEVKDSQRSGSPALKTA